MNSKERTTPLTESNTPSVEPIEVFPGQEIQTRAFKKTSRMLQVEKEIKVDLPEFLKRKCPKEGLSKRLTSAEIAEELGISARTVRRWMKNLGIETRNSSRDRAKYGYIRVHKGGDPNLVEQARRQGFLTLINEIFRNA